MFVVTPVQEFNIRHLPKIKVIKKVIFSYYFLFYLQKVNNVKIKIFQAH